MRKLPPTPLDRLLSSLPLRKTTSGKEGIEPPKPDGQEFEEIPADPRWTEDNNS